MAKGNPLTDEDRWDWLISLRKAAIDALSPSQANNFHPPSGVVVACSALKQKYRDVMRVAAYGSPSVQIHFIYLKLDRDTLIDRITKRDPSHYMKSGMVQSQLQALEEPQEEWDALTVNADGPREEVQRMVLQRVSEKLAEYQ
jgi:gluconokinase